MKDSVKITGMIVGGVLVVVLLAIYVTFQLVPTETIQVSGSATVSVVPDMVSLNFNVETSGETAQEAKDANALVVDEVITALIKEGFERDEIVTQNFNVYEEYDYSYIKRTSIGYKATHRIVVKFSTEDSDRIGETIDAAIDAGAMLSYINFELSTELENQYKAEALKAATADAKVKAEAMAEGLGAKLGSAVSTTSSDSGYYTWRAYGVDEDVVSISGASVETSIQPGEQDITGRVTVVYKLK